MTPEKRVTKRSAIFYKFLYFFARIASIFIWRYKRVNKYRIKKGETVLVLSNHQSDIDPILILQSFNRPVYTVATDNLFTGKMGIWFFSKALGAIPKRKGAHDIRATAEMIKTVKQGGSVLVFPEGNRSYAEFQYPITDEFGKFVKMFKSTLVIFNLHGGTGVYPRWGNKKRRGKFYGEVKFALPYEDYKDYTDEELTQTIRENLKVFDSESNNRYKSKKRAEYLERMLFVCPKCGKTQTMYSKLEFVNCNSCGLKVEFTEDLRLKSDDQAFTFTRLNEWYQFQKKYVREMKIEPGKLIFEDEEVTLKLSNPFSKSIQLCTGKMELTDQELKVGDQVFDISKITSSSPISGRKLQITYEDNSYIIRGNDRFNPLKYVLLFNKLDTDMKKNKTDIYYNLEN